MTYFLVDCEAPFGLGAPSVTDMTKFGAVELASRASFYGPDCAQRTFELFELWLRRFPPRPIFVSDNVAYDWQWINFYFWRYLGHNPFGHSGRRISDFYAGLRGDFDQQSGWKRLRQTKHDHNPVHDAMGNAEALAKLLADVGTKV